MLGDLKEKAAGIDRKRIYTAAAALLIAGAAGHFMQRTSGGSDDPTTIASVPPVSAPEILAAPPEMPTSAEIAVAPAPDPAPAVAPMVEDAEPDADIVAEAATGAPEIAPAEATPEAAPETAPVVANAAPAQAEAEGGVVTDLIAVFRPKPKPAIIPGSAESVASLVTEDTALEATPEMIAETGTPSTGIYPAPKADAILEEVTRAASDPLLTIVEPTPERDKTAVFAAASDPLGMTDADVIAPAEPEMAGCAIDVTGTAKPGAMLQITVAAPCNSGEAVSFEHAGLRFGEQLGPDGSLTIDVPAMTGTAHVALNFADGTDRDVEVTLPDFEAFDRIAVIWQGATGLQLHALEGEAGYGEAGHIWADTPGTPDAAVNGTGGFLSVLGSTASGYAADVYTYPVDLMGKGMEPLVSVEAQVMENTCGGRIEGAILRSNPSRDPNVEPLTMVVPGCDAVGDFLVLRDLPVALKLARR